MLLLLLLFVAVCQTDVGARQADGKQNKGLDKNSCSAVPMVSAVKATSRPSGLRGNENRYRTAFTWT